MKYHYIILLNAKIFLTKKYYLRSFKKKQQ